MGLRAKWQFIVGTFAFCWMLYFLVPCVGSGECLAVMSNLFESEAFNLVFLMILFLSISVLAADAAEFFYLRFRSLRWFRPRLGEVLVSRGFISRQELDEALEEQKLRIGDVLLQEGKVTPVELEHARDYQQSHEGMRLGQALVELEYVSKQEISWAVSQINRKLGMILVDKGWITEFDLRRVLARMWYGRFRGR